MSILKIRDDNGNVQEILTIKGDKGDTGIQGPRGEKGDKGDKPINGIDYNTQEEHDAIVSDVLAEIPDAADYVVEQDIINGWTYRKWNSGIAESWIHTTVSTSWFDGQSNRRISIMELPAPSMFLDGPVVNITVAGGGSAYLIIPTETGYIPTTVTDDAIVYSTLASFDDNPPDAGVFVNIHLIGKYK